MAPRPMSTTSSLRGAAAESAEQPAQPEHRRPVPLWVGDQHVGEEGAGDGRGVRGIAPRGTGNEGDQIVGEVGRVTGRLAEVVGVMVGLHDHHLAHQGVAQPFPLGEDPPARRCGQGTGRRLPGGVVTGRGRDEQQRGAGSATRWRVSWFGSSLAQRLVVAQMPIRVLASAPGGRIMDSGSSTTMRESVDAGKEVDSRVAEGGGLGLGADLGERTLHGPAIGNDAEELLEVDEERIVPQAGEELDAGGGAQDRVDRPGDGGRHREPAALAAGALGCRRTEQGDLLPRAGRRRR